MTQFRVAVTRRFRWLIGVNALFTLIVVLTALYGYDDQTDAGDFVHGLQIGVFIGMQLMILLLIRKLRNALKDETTLKTLQQFSLMIKNNKQEIIS